MEESWKHGGCYIGHYHLSHIAIARIYRPDPSLPHPLGRFHECSDDSPSNPVSRWRLAAESGAATRVASLEHPITQPSGASSTSIESVISIRHNQCAISRLMSHNPPPQQPATLVTLASALDVFAIGTVNSARPWTLARVRITCSSRLSPESICASSLKHASSPGNPRNQVLYPLHSLLATLLTIGSSDLNTLIVTSPRQPNPASQHPS